MSSVLLEYGWAPTPFHRMHPFTKMFLTMILGGLVTLWWDYLFAVPLLVLLFILTKVASVPKTWYNIIWAGISVASLNRIISFLYGSATPFKVYPPELTQMVIGRLTPAGTPILGEVVITVGSVLWLGMSLIHMVSSIFVIMIFLYSTSIMDLCNILAKYGVPNVVMFILIAIVRFTTIIQRTLLTIMNAQKLRGWKLSRNPIQFVRDAAPLLYPLTYVTITMVDEVTNATKIRAFGIRKISPMKVFVWPMREKLLVIVLTVVLAIAIWAQFLSGYNIGMF